MVVGLDEKRTQRAGPAFDVNLSLIYIEATGESAHALLLAAGRIHRQVRFHDSVLLLEKACALLLPATPFSGAQAVAGQISLHLADVSCELHVYHGATAMVVLQHLREAGARPLSQDESDEMSSLVTRKGEDRNQAEQKENTSDMLPYLAFLTTYPSLRLLHLLPYELACRYQCVPVGAERKMLTLATCHWLNRETVVHLSTATRREIFQVRCEITIIDEVLRYWQRIQQEMIDLDCAGLKREGL